MALSESKNVKLGIIISYISLVVTIVGNIFVTRYVLSAVGDYNFGLSSFVTSVSVWLTIIGEALTLSFVRFATIEQKNYGSENQTKTLFNLIFKVLAAIIIVGAGITLLVCRLNNVLLFNYPKESSDILYVLFVFSIIQIGMSTAFTLYPIVVNYRRKFVFSKGMVLLVNILTFFGHWLFAYLTKNIVYVALTGIIVTGINLFTQFLYVKLALKEKGFYKTKIVDKTLLRSLTIFSGILILDIIVGQLNNHIDKTILGVMGRPEDVTIYQIGQQFSSYLVLLSASIAAVFIPITNEYVVHNQNDKINDLFIKVSRLQIIVISTVVFGFLTCGREFIFLWLGEGKLASYYIGAAWLFIFLCPETMNFTLEVQRARNKHFFRFFAFLLLAFINIGLTILFIHLFPKDKVIYACLLGSVIGCILSNWIALNLYNGIKMKLPIPKYLMYLFIHIGAGLACFGVVYLIYRFTPLYNSHNYWMLFFLKGFLFVLLYGALLFIFDGKYLKGILIGYKNRKKGQTEPTPEPVPETVQE